MSKKKIGFGLKVGILIGFILGFVVAAHWNSGRKMLMELSPLKGDAIGNTGKVLMDEAQDTVDRVKKKVVK